MAERVTDLSMLHTLVCCCNGIKILDLQEEGFCIEEYDIVLTKSGVKRNFMI